MPDILNFLTPGQQGLSPADTGELDQAYDVRTLTDDSEAPLEEGVEPGALSINDDVSGSCPCACSEGLWGPSVLERDVVGGRCECSLCGDVGETC